MSRTSRDAQRRRRIAAVSLGVALVALGWAALLVATGGFDVTLAGLTITTHDSTRPTLVGLIALALFVWAHGAPRLVRQGASFGSASNQWLAQRPIKDRPIVFVLAAGVLVFGVVWGTGVAGGSDSYGYLSQAELWRSGLPIVPQPWAAEAPWPNAEWTFAPLGYRVADGQGAIVPIYAVGLPLLMAAVKTLAGHAAMFWIVPTAGAVLVLVTYGVGLRLGSARAGLIAAWLVAINPTLVGEVTAPMSDVLAAVALAGSCYLLLSSAPRAPLYGGLAAALAVVVRPNLAPTLIVMALWLAVRREAGRDRLSRTQIARALTFAIAASPGILIPAWANWRLFGSPFVSGYGNLQSIYDWSHLLPNLRRYPALFIESHAGVVLLGLAALLVPVRRLWPEGTDRSLLAGVALFVFSLVGQYLIYEPATGGGYLRFLLPCLPFAMVGVARLALLFARPGWPGAVVGLAIVAYGLSGLYQISQRGGFDLRSERKYPAAAELARARTEPESVILSMQHSGSLRYYAGRMTMRYDLLDPAWLDRSVAWLSERGVHTYALLDDWEARDFRRRFAGQARVASLDTPVFIYQGAVAVHFYDLLRTPAERAPAVRIVDRFDGPRYPRPAPPLQFQFAR